MPVRVKPKEPQSPIPRTKGLDSMKKTAMVVGLTTTMLVAPLAAATHVHAVDQVRADRAAGQAALLMPDVAPSQGTIKGQDYNDELFLWMAAYSWRSKYDPIPGSYYDVRPTTTIVSNREEFPSNADDWRLKLKQAGWRWGSAKRQSNEGRKVLGFVDINHVPGSYQTTNPTEGWEHLGRPPTVADMFENTQHPRYKRFSSGDKYDSRYVGISRPYFSEYLNDRFVPVKGRSSEVVLHGANRGHFRPLGQLATRETELADIREVVSQNATWKNASKVAESRAKAELIQPVTVLPSDPEYKPDHTQYATRVVDYNNDLPRVFHLDGRPLVVEFNTRAGYGYHMFKSEYQEQMYSEWLRANQHNHEVYDAERLGHWLRDKAHPEQLNNRTVTTEEMAPKPSKLAPWQKAASVYGERYCKGELTGGEYRQKMYNLLYHNGIITDWQYPSTIRNAANDETPYIPIAKDKQLVLRDQYNIGPLINKWYNNWFFQESLKYVLEIQLADTYSSEALDGISEEQLDAHVTEFMKRYEQLKFKDKVMSFHLPTKRLVFSVQPLPPITDLAIEKKFSASEFGLLVPNGDYEILHPGSASEVLPATA